MQVHHNHSLKTFNTFGIEATSRYFATVTSLEELRELYQQYPDTAKLPLGGGSNVLLTRDYDGLAYKLALMGRTVVKETATHVWVKAGAGEVWHDLVLWCVANGWAGIENLSLIPGCVGAAPMQNIGAYGVELKDVFDHLEAWLTEEDRVIQFDGPTCNFGYRTSIFKQELKGKAVILNVTLKLSKQASVNTSYGAIEQELTTLGIQTPTIKDVSAAVIRIRQSKLPDPAEIGNAGSFFKNPVVSSEVAKKVLTKYPNAPHYPVEEGQVKIPAGWLIETAGWKGRTFDDRFGVHKKQALVLVNYNHATGREIYDLSQNILESIYDQFRIQLEREVNIIE